MNDLSASHESPHKHGHCIDLAVQNHQQNLFSSEPKTSQSPSRHVSVTVREPTRSSYGDLGEQQSAEGAGQSLYTGTYDTRHGMLQRGPVEPGSQAGPPFHNFDYGPSIQYQDNFDPSTIRMQQETESRQRLNMFDREAEPTMASALNSYSAQRAGRSGGSPLRVMSQHKPALDDHVLPHPPPGHHFYQG